MKHCLRSMILKATLGTWEHNVGSYSGPYSQNDMDPVSTRRSSPVPHLGRVSLQPSEVSTSAPPRWPLQ